jgi:Fur family peroxide stress response transcriptional regulator
MNSEKKKYKRSRQRDRIMEILQGTKSHPSADWLYDRLKKEFPNLSMGTVYRNLNILSEQGLIQKIDFGSTFNRFDADVSPHYHLICEKCSSVADIKLPIYDEINEKVEKMANFSINRHRIEFYGLCKNCEEHIRRNKKSSSG